MRLSKILFSICLLICNISKAQKKAITDTGEEVILYENGTWKYFKEFDSNDSNVIKINPVVFSKSSNASFLLKSNHGNIGFWIDPKKWTFGKSATNPSADFELEFKGQSIQGVIISEAVEIPLESYIQIAIQNGRLSSPDLKLLHKEYRIVNDIKVLHLQMEGTQSGVKFSYYAYYFSNENSTVQFLVASYQKTMSKYLREAEELLNGITEIKVTQPDSLKVMGKLNPKPKDSIPQGLYSPNNNCRQFFPGKWSYSANGRKIQVERTLKTTIEYTDDRKFKFEYSNKWINDCSYEITFIGTTKPKYNLMKVGEVMKVDILEIDRDRMKYNVLFRGLDIRGEMLNDNN